MKKTLTFKEKLMRFIKDQDTLEEKIFWGIVPLTFFVVLASVIGTITENLGTFAVISGVVCAIVPVVLAISCYRHGNQCAKYYKIFCIFLNGLLIPTTFLCNGGLHSGMPMYCLGGFLLCAFCINRNDRHIAGSISFFAYFAWFMVSKFYPQIVIPIRESFVDYDIMMSFGMAAISMLVLISKAMEGYKTQRFKEVNNGLIDSLGAIIEFRSLETGNHVRNIKRFTEAMLHCANELIPEANYNAEEISMISSAAVLHDIGKVAVPDNVLQKPGRLTPEEFEIIKRHPVDGCAMIATMKKYQNHTYYEYCYEICRHHHERYDGTGYPDGLKGEEIPLISQIVAIADVYEALTSKRVYKAAYSLDKATDIIVNHSPGMFSDRIIACFLKAKPRLDEIITETEEMEEIDIGKELAIPANCL